MITKIFYELCTLARYWDLIGYIFEEKFYADPVHREEAEFFAENIPRTTKACKSALMDEEIPVLSETLDTLAVLISDLSKKRKKPDDIQEISRLSCSIAESLIQVVTTANTDVAPQLYRRQDTDTLQSVLAEGASEVSSELSEADYSYDDENYKSDADWETSSIPDLSGIPSGVSGPSSATAGGQTAAQHYRSSSTSSAVADIVDNPELAAPAAVLDLGAPPAAVLDVDAAPADPADVDAVPASALDVDVSPPAPAAPKSKKSASSQKKAGWKKYF